MVHKVNCHSVAVCLLFERFAPPLLWVLLFMRIAFFVCSLLVCGGLLWTFLITRNPPSKAKTATAPAHQRTAVAERTSRDFSAITLPVDPDPLGAPVDANLTPEVTQLMAAAQGKSPIPPNLWELLPSVTRIEDIQAVLRMIQDTAASDTVRHEGIELLRRSNVRELTNTLIQIAKSEREIPRFKAFIAQHLSLQLESAPEVERPPLEAELENLLRNAYAEVRREALWGLIPSGHQAALHVLHTGLADQDWRADRDVIIRGLQAIDHKAAIPEIRRLANDDADPVVRIAAIEALGAFGDLDSVPVLDRCIEAEDANVRAAAIRVRFALHAQSRQPSTPSHSPATGQATSAPVHLP